MKQTILIFLITFLFTSYSYAFEATVILIADGDTITVVHNGKPEFGQKNGLRECPRVDVI